MIKFHSIESAYKKIHYLYRHNAVEIFLKEYCVIAKIQDVKFAFQ